MKKLIFFGALSLAFLFSCKGKENPVSEEVEVSEAEAEINEFTQCFLLVENQDSTFVSLTIHGLEVIGIMNWIPFEKDGARGYLNGSRNSNDGSYDLIYTYTIEGSKQTETINMKIENDKLYIKEGELEDPNFDGNLVYKDASSAVYGEGISSVPCK